MEYVYLLKTRESIRLNENIYKIGRTSQQGMTRFYQYPTGSQLYLHINCYNSKKREDQIIELFNKKYKSIKEYGREYFEGELNNMKNDILHIVFYKNDDEINQKQNDNLIIDKLDKKQNKEIKTEPNNENKVSKIQNIINQIKTNKLKKDSNSIEKHYCQQCKSNFKSRSGLYKHKKQYHPDEFNKEKKTNNKKCQYCKNEFSSYISKWKHEKICKYNKSKLKSIQNIVKVTNPNNFKKIINVYTFGNESKYNLSKDYLNGSGK